VTLVVLAPLRVEAFALRGVDGIEVRRVGMGAHSADVSGADAVAVAGFCGAVDPELRAGDVVLADEVRSADGVRPCPASELLRRALERDGLRVHIGAVHSAPQIVGPEQREHLGGDGVVAVDMESYWLADAAGAGVMAVVRVTVDEAGRRLLHPRTIPAGVRAFRSLRRAGVVLGRTRMATTMSTLRL
jgi:4-hydroxy-3-methylbut-2-enyl diphosphate reductase